MLIGIGVVVGMAAVAGLAVGFDPARLPAEILKIAVYKLTFIAAGGLLAAGAILHRYTRRARGQTMIDRGDLPAEELRKRERESNDLNGPR